MISPEERKPSVFSPSKDRSKLSWEDLYTFLYGRREVVAVDPEDVRHKYDKKRRLSQDKLETGKHIIFSNKNSELMTWSFAFIIWKTQLLHPFS